MELTAESLISGYETYANLDNLTKTADITAPASTPAILSVIGLSSEGCGVGVSVIGASIVSTFAKGC